MKSMSYKLARMPKFISFYKKVVHIFAIVLLGPFVFLSVTILAVIGFLISVFYKEKDDPCVADGLYESDIGRGALTAKQIEKEVDHWINAHREKFNSIEKKQATTANDPYLEISLYPKNDKAIPISFELGGEIILYIRFWNSTGRETDHGFEFDTENDRGYKSINALELRNILSCYLQGNYYSIDSMIEEKVVSSEFHLKTQEKEYVSYSGEPCIFERKAAIQRKVDFEHL